MSTEPSSQPNRTVGEARDPAELFGGLERAHLWGRSSALIFSAVQGYWNTGSGMVVLLTELAKFGWRKA